MVLSRSALVPNFHLNLFNDITSLDVDGSEFADLAAATASAVYAARALIADHVVAGQPINLRDRIEVTDAVGRPLAVVAFRDVITLTES